MTAQCIDCGTEVEEGPLCEHCAPFVAATLKQWEAFPPRSLPPRIKTKAARHLACCKVCRPEMTALKLAVIVAMLAPAAQAHQTRYHKEPWIDLCMATLSPSSQRGEELCLNAWIKLSTMPTCELGYGGTTIDCD